MVQFDHILTDEEVLSLESRFGMKFSRVDGKVQRWSPIYGALVPWDSIVPLAEISIVLQIDTDMGVFRSP